MTTEKKLPFMLPNEPVDGYTVKYYDLSMCELWCYIKETVCVYHVHTPWYIYAPNRKGGADLIDDWMISVEGSDVGRIDNWSDIIKISSEDIFATRKEAIQESIIRYDRYIARATKRIRELEALRMHQKVLLNG